MNRTARILAVILALVLVSGGIYVSYQNGFDSGVAAAQIAEAGDNGQTLVVEDRWRGRGGYGFFPFFWIFPLLFFFLIFGAFRRRGSWGGPGGGHWDSRQEFIEGKFREMHDKAHGQPTQS